MEDKLNYLLDALRYKDDEIKSFPLQLTQEEQDILVQYIDSLENKIDKIKEHTTYIIGITDDERVLAECNLIDELLK